MERNEQALSVFDNKLERTSKVRSKLKITRISNNLNLGTGHYKTISFSFNCLTDVKRMICSLRINSKDIPLHNNYTSIVYQ